MNYDEELNQSLDFNHCFLCGKSIQAKHGKTDEDVIPTWLKKRYKLSTSSINLPIGGKISYNHLKIPCCKRCNNEWLSRIENTVSQAVKKGSEALASIDQFTLYLWLAKIYYGMHFKHLNTFLDIKDKSRGYLNTPNDIKHLVDIHRILQATIGKTKITKFPGSIFIYKSQAPKEIVEQYDFADGITPFISFRMGTVSIMASLLDFGAIKYHPYIKIYDKAAAKIELHPVQHTEITTLFMYATHLFNRSPTYIIQKQSDVDVIHPLTMTMSRKPIFDDFDFKLYAKELSLKLNRPYEEIYSGDNLVGSTILDHNGKPRILPI